MVEMSERTNGSIREHMRSGAALLEHALLDLQKRDADAVAGARALLKAGGLLSIRTTLSAAGFAHLAVSISTPGGDVHELLSCELQRDLRQ